MSERATVRLLVVGDTHGAWDAVDVRFVEDAAPDALLVVGDLGDQEARMVEPFADLAVPTFVVLGNHDAWFASRGGPLEPLRALEARLGDRNLAYAARELPGTGVALVGGRPYSWGGPLRDHRRFYADHLGIRDESESADRIVEAALSVDAPTLVVVAHNGPTGLGSDADSIYGRDFRRPPRDWGDADLRLALDVLRDEGRHVALVVAGHMHERLVGGGRRTRVVQDRRTLHLNAAVVPRHRQGPTGAIRRHFMEVVLTDGEVVSHRDLWVGDDARPIE